MKKLFWVLVITNLAVFIWIKSKPATADQPLEWAVERNYCYLVQTLNREKLHSFRDALVKIGRSSTVVESQAWVDGDATWVVAEATQAEWSDYKMIVPSSYWIVGGPKDGYLSLGIFGNSANAERLGRQIEEKNLSFDILPYQQKVPLWQVSFDGVEAESLINTYQLEFIEKKSC